MKPQFDHRLQSSFYLWVDDRMTRYWEAVESGITQTFHYSSLGVDIPSNQVAYYSPDRQLVGNGLDVPSGVWVSGILDNAGAPMDYTFVGQTTGLDPDPTGLMIDFDLGRVVMGTGITTGDATSLSITGGFNRKAFNVYMTNETEEQLLLNSDFIIADQSDETFLQNVTGLGSPNYTLPAAFVSYNASMNKPFAFGGMQDTRSNIRVVTVSEDNYELDGVLSLFRDSTEVAVPLVAFADFPYGEYFHIKNPPYTYSGLYDSLMSKDGAKYSFIEKVTCSKLFDRTYSQLSPNLKVGFIDFQISTPRFPKIEISE